MLLTYRHSYRFKAIFLGSVAIHKSLRVWFKVMKHCGQNSQLVHNVVSVVEMCLAKLNPNLY